MTDSRRKEQKFASVPEGSSSLRHRDQAQTFFLEEQMDNITLTPHQSESAKVILQYLTGQTDHKQTVLAGSAGSGKTLTVGHIVEALVSKGYSVHLCAHAHTAVAQIKKALPEAVRGSVEASTIFSALGWRYSTKSQSSVASGGHRLAGVDVVVIDEASMIDDVMYEAFARLSDDTARPGVRLLWVGDPAQLPPVNPDNQKDVSPVFSRVQIQHRLNEVVRQAQDSPIIRASIYVRECLEKDVKPCLRELQARAGDDDRVTITSGGIAAVAEYTASAISAGLDARAVAYRNKTIDACIRIIAKKTHPEGSERLVVGDPVTFGTRYGENVSTNTSAIVTSVSECKDDHMECLKVTLKIDGVSDQGEIITPKSLDDLRRLNGALKSTHSREKIKEQKAKDAGDTSAAMAARSAYYRAGEALQEVSDHYADLRLIYSMTAHKAQGSTFDVAVIDWKDMQSCSDLSTMCRLLYVAVTRPSKFLIIVE